MINCKMIFILCMIGTLHIINAAHHDADGFIRFVCVRKAKGGTCAQVIKKKVSYKTIVDGVSRSVGPQYSTQHLTNYLQFCHYNNPNELQMVCQLYKRPHGDQNQLIDFAERAQSYAYPGQRIQRMIQPQLPAETESLLARLCAGLCSIFSRN